MENSVEKITLSSNTLYSNHILFRMALGSLVHAVSERVHGRRAGHSTRWRARSRILGTSYRGVRHLPINSSANQLWRVMRSLSCLGFLSLFEKYYSYMIYSLYLKIQRPVKLRIVLLLEDSLSENVQVCIGISFSSNSNRFHRQIRYRKLSIQSSFRNILASFSRNLSNSIVHRSKSRFSFVDV